TRDPPDLLHGLPAGWRAPSFPVYHKDANGARSRTPEAGGVLAEPSALVGGGEQAGVGGVGPKGREVLILAGAATVAGLQLESPLEGGGGLLQLSPAGVKGGGQVGMAGILVELALAG